MNRFVLLIAFAALASLSIAPAQADSPNEPLRFIENQGQFAPEVLYMAHTDMGVL